MGLLAVRPEEVLGRLEEQQAIARLLPGKLPPVSADQLAAELARLNEAGKHEAVSAGFPAAGHAAGATAATAAQLLRCQPSCARRCSACPAAAALLSAQTESCSAAPGPYGALTRPRRACLLPGCRLCVGALPDGGPHERGGPKR